ncbi:hypothetical protein BJ508DRAFT_310634 [Ascobolus immersus RN42]|uniref:Extracellular membrane protein CFEM domain-containing protein n=1 Tax=Ascobolus immersus RN42 TaxID=1160509 RepID=A0A3N4I4V1_ASCIM|nr:hypothetical protein BJ508DRAFT_310634 [Ascobolus immersus RN42]
MRLPQSIPFLALALPLLASAGAASNVTAIPKITKLTDLDSLITTFPVCDRKCTKQHYLDIFNSKTLRPKCATITGQKNENIDWRCLCYPENTDTTAGNKTIQDSYKKMSECDAVEYAKPECKGEHVDSGDYLDIWDEHNGNFAEYCMQRFGVNGTLEDREKLEEAAKSSAPAIAESAGPFASLVVVFFVTAFSSLL